MNVPMFHSPFLAPFTVPLRDVDAHAFQHLGTQPHVVLILHLIPLHQGIKLLAEVVIEAAQPRLTPA